MSGVRFGWEQVIDFNAGLQYKGVYGKQEERGMEYRMMYYLILREGYDTTCDNIIVYCSIEGLLKG